MELKSFSMAITHNGEDFFALCFAYVKHGAMSGHGAKIVCARFQESDQQRCSWFRYIKLAVLNGKPHIQKGVKRINRCGREKYLYFFVVLFCCDSRFLNDTFVQLFTLRPPHFGYSLYTHSLLKNEFFNEFFSKCSS